MGEGIQYNSSLEGYYLGRPIRRSLESRVPIVIAAVGATAALAYTALTEPYNPVNARTFNSVPDLSIIDMDKTKEGRVVVTEGLVAKTLPSLNAPRTPNSKWLQWGQKLDWTKEVVKVGPKLLREAFTAQLLGQDLTQEVWVEKEDKEGKYYFASKIGKARYIEEKVK